jgi:predicted nucleic acid-binding protein
MAWLLDTNILSERRKPKPEPKVTAFYESQPLNALYISVVSIAEIRFGIELQQDVTRRAELNEWLIRTLRPAFRGRILPVTEDVLLKWRTLMEDGTYLFQPRPFACSNGPAARVYGGHSRPERFRQGRGAGVQPVGAVSPRPCF